MVHIIDISKYVSNTCFIISNAFSDNECNLLYKNKYNKAITHYPTTYRNNERLVIDDNELSYKLFIKMKEYLPSFINSDNKQWKIKELNSRLRFCKYNENQYFNKHLDGVYYKSSTIQSKLTFMIYLNGNNEFEGGETLFYPSFNDDTILYKYHPKKGDLIIFDHNIWHSGNILTKGTKYILRSDILYEDISNTSNNRIEYPIQSFYKPHLGYIWQICKYSNNRILSCGRDCFIKCWDCNGILLNEFKACNQSTLCLEVINDKCFISASRDCIIKIWKESNSNSFKEISFIKNCHNGAILSLIKVNNNEFLSSGADEIIHKWNINTLECIQSWKYHNNWIWNIKLLNNNILCSVSEDNTCKIISLYDDKIIDEFIHNDAISSCIYDNNSNSLYIGTNDGIIIHFNVLSNWKLEYKNKWNAHNGKIWIIVITSSYIISGSEDCSIKYWNRNNNYSLQQEYYHNNFVRSLIIFNDKLLSASYDSTIKQWDL